MLQCFNRGCGMKFDPNDNKEDACRHHPGAPYFHDAYKGWSCCNKKSVDFTEFLNTKGCTLSRHSNEKPPEPEKEQKEVNYEEPPIEIRQPIKQFLDRPSFNSQLLTITPTIQPALKKAVDSLVSKNITCIEEPRSGEVVIGTTCKNGGCHYTYSSPESGESECRYHPGTPVFHEGLKFWSCCTKRTSDFTAFMNQPGCAYGNHKWIDDDNDKETVNCRYDWHQTASNVIIAIYAKLYHYEKSTISLNPIRLKVCLVFPEQHNAQFNLDLELRGIVIVENTTVKMFGTKVEITMPKAEPGSWSKLDFPRVKEADKRSQESDVKSKKLDRHDSDSDVDLDEIQPVMDAKITNLL